MRLLTLVFLAAALTLAGCGTRSISNTGFDASESRHSRGNPLYRGELSEFDVLGIERDANPSDAEIGHALDSHVRVRLPRGASVLLVQSGAPIPDDPMRTALERYFDLGVFTGIPDNRSDRASTAGYNRALRLAAARAGRDKLIVYWGVLESARENLASSAVSWVPVVGWVLPDERQRMRIRLTIAIIDVRTGAWEMHTPAPIEDRDFSSILSRRATDQALVEALKERAYPAAAESIVARYSSR